MDQGASLGTQVRGEAASMGQLVDVDEGDVVSLGPEAKATLLSTKALYAKAKEYADTADD